MNNKKSILFLSALDFKEKSIQVIRKTPEAYINAGWDVNYIVVRDNSIYDNYYYEKEINIPGLKLQRINLPIQSVISKYGKNKIVRRILQKFAYFLAIIKLFILAKKILKDEKVDVVYGYEIHGVLATNLLRFFRYLRNKKIVSRFQGTFGSYYYFHKMYKKMFASSDHYLAMYLPSDLCIMTNDGTQGDKALKIIRSHNLKNYRFWVNGVDEQKLDIEISENLKKQYNPYNELIFLSVCRLERWKRVDRGIRALSYLKNNFGVTNFKYYIIGEGVEKENLMKLANESNLEENMIFTGAIPNNKVKFFLNLADFFISTYDTSNVGNPLLEAIRSHKIIFTLNNGDTGTWIQHKKNGFIYNIDENLSQSMAKDMYEMRDINMRKKILENIRSTEIEKLWTWEERMNAEIYEVEKLLI